MKSMRWLVAAVAFLATGPFATAQEAPTPGPEHEVLKKWVGTWDTTMTLAGMESKGTATYKMEVDGLWLVSTFEGEIGGAKFSGKGLDGYDAGKKKYVGVWVDNKSQSPMILEGTFDKAKKTLTMEGEGPGGDGKPTKYKAVSVMKDEDTVVFSMYMENRLGAIFTIVYKRKK